MVIGKEKNEKKSVSLKISTVTTLFSMVTVAPPHDPLPNRYRYCVEYSLGKFDLVMLKLCSSNSVLWANNPSSPDECTDHTTEE